MKRPYIVVLMFTAIFAASGFTLFVGGWVLATPFLIGLSLQPLIFTHVRRMIIEIDRKAETKW